MLSFFQRTVSKLHGYTLPTISFRAPFPALLAFLLFPFSFLFPKYSTHPVPTNANTAALHARFCSTQSCARAVNECEVWTGGRFLDTGRIADGSQD